MDTLHLIKLRRAEDEESAEFRFLFEVVVLEARRAYDRVEVSVGRRPETIEVPEGGGDVLAMSDANVMLCSTSLRHMRSKLRDGFDVLIPQQLAAVLTPEDLPPYTLRDFEEIEARFLAATPPDAPEGPSHLPIALWTGDGFRRAVENVTIVRLFEDRESLSEIGIPLEIGHAGLCHQFIDYYGEVRADVLPLVPAKVEDVLEVGCGRGHTGAYLRRELGCRVTGVELNPAVAREAEANLDRVIVGDIAEVDIRGRFDVVLAFELLEHLAESEAFLSGMRRLVRPGGRIVLSVPNVGHYSLVEDLLAGRWDYLPIGLLCNTHLRFFTRRTLEDLLGRCGFDHFELVAQRTELPPDFQELDPRFAADLDSLATKGFYAVLYC